MTQSLMCSGFPRNRLPNSALAPSVSGPLEAYSPAPAVALAHVSMRNRAASPSCMDTQVWVRGPTRTHQLVIARWVRGLTRTCQRYRPRWYQSRAFVWMWCSLYLAGRLHVIPCGTTAGPLRHDSRVCVRGLTRTRHKVLLRRCMCARPNTHVPMGYTSLVSLYVDAVCGYGVQVIPCGVGCVLYLAGSPVGPLTKASHNGGCRMLLLMNSIASRAYSMNTSSLRLASPWSRITRKP